MARRDARDHRRWPPSTEGVRLVAEAGIDRIRAKGVALTEYAIALFDARLARIGFELGSPRDPPVAVPTSRSATRMRAT